METAAKEADGLYRQIVTAATAFLGASLFVIEKLRPLGLCSIILLIIGGISLCVTIVSTAYIRWMNLCSLRLIAEGTIGKAKCCDRLNRCLTWGAIGLFGVGIISMALTIIIAVITTPTGKG